MRYDGIQVEPSWGLLIIAGLAILAGVPSGLTENFTYWLVTRLLYGLGIILFLLGR